MINLDQIAAELGGNESAIADRLRAEGIDDVNAVALARLAVHGPQYEDERVAVDDEGNTVEVNGVPVHGG